MSDALKLEIEEKSLRGETYFIVFDAKKADVDHRVEVKNGLLFCECGEFERTGFPCPGEALATTKGRRLVRVADRWYKSYIDASDEAVSKML